MDFVVTGLGLSALALLTGLALLCLVAPRWSRKSRAAHPEDGAYARALAGERSALGQGFLCVGAVLLLATLGGISAGLADKTGAYLVAAMATVALLGLFGWDLLYRRQHPLPRRRRVAPTRPIPADAEAAPAAVASTPPTGSPATTATTVRRRVLPARQRVAPAPPPPSAAESLTAAEREPDVVPSADEAHSVGTAAASLGIADDEAAAGPENPEPVATSGAHGDLPAAKSSEAEEPARAEPEAAAPTVAAVDIPEPVAIAPAQTNGTPEPGAVSALGDAPDASPGGDDRVIALFPTAAARRSRMLTAPTDPDGKN